MSGKIKDCPYTIIKEPREVDAIGKHSRVCTSTVIPHRKAAIAIYMDVVIFTVTIE